MTLGTIRTAKLENFAQRFLRGLVFPSRSPKTHDYTQYQQGIDYQFEVHDRQGYMTGQGQGIHPGEFVRLNVNGTVQCYEVKSIDYYASPSTMWLALLNRIDER